MPNDIPALLKQACLDWQYENEGSQRMLCKKLGICTSTMTEWLKGQPIPMRQWKNIEEVLGIDLWEYYPLKSDVKY